MKRTIFIGSSHEGYSDAQRVCDAIRQLGEEGLDPQLWTSFFHAGSLTFEALEDMLLQCCGAVFVIRRDDVVRHLDHNGSVVNRGKATYMPRGNVLVEFGLVAGRLGRPNVALCKLEAAELPSDLAGMTFIDMCPETEVGDAETAGPPPFSEDVLGKVRNWVSHLLPTPATIERTVVYHGYTGRWEFELHLKKWRGLPMADPLTYAVVNGYLDLFVAPEGSGSTGTASGILSCRLQACEEGPIYLADFQMFHTITNIDCDDDGGLELTSHMVAVHKFNETGEAPPPLHTIGCGSEPWSFNWKLRATDAGPLIGEVKTSASGGTEGDITARKLRMLR